MNKHTPAPWREGVEFWDIVAGDEEDEFVIAGIIHVGEPETREANSRLIAAAPELLEALEAMEETVNQVVSGIRNGSTVEWVALLTKAQAAIRKATGEQ
jgi:hypothetical protein